VKEVVLAAAKAGVAWVAIHGRTRAQGYSGSADWELIRSVSVESPIPILGNGDVLTAADAHRRINEGYCNAVMIGRGVLKNPWLFREILGERSDKETFADLVARHFDLALEHKGEYRAFLSHKKFNAWYA
jgi:tRNA-dihydrouridine synthase B